MRRFFFALSLLAACEDASSEPLFDANLPANFDDAGTHARTDAASQGPPVDSGQVDRVDSGPVAPRALETERVWAPANARYVNEPTLIRADDGTWHVFSNGAAGKGNPWVELQLLHATAPALMGPWTDQPDILTTLDDDAVEGSLHAPFVMRDGDVYRIYYYDSTMPDDQGLRTATSRDLFAWQRDPAPILGGRDPMILRLPGVNYLYSVGTVLDGSIFDIVRLQSASNLTDWVRLTPALRNPKPCPDNCWGWYESPFVVPRFGGYFLFTTFTSSDFDDYENTTVHFSYDPTRFEPTPMTTLRAHGGEIHEENGTTYLTHGGWPEKSRRQPGLYVTRLAW